ncbi:MAG TPA: ABC transporter substrate-binding protein [Chloroflexota bacterium]|nr:ABC transporter substrate-binding protein [Chloroflexota bacterium]
MAVTRHPVLGPLGTWRRRGFLGLTPLALAAAACGPSSATTTKESAPAGQQPPAGQQQPAPQGQPIKGGTLTFAGIGDAKSMMPLITNDTASSDYQGMHWDAPLLRRNPDTLEWDTKYGAAEAYQISPDGLTYTFKLKSNLQWSDGKPITAGDWAFTFQKMMDPKVDYPYKNNYKIVESIAAPDDKTLTMKITEPFCPAVERALFVPIPKHIYEGLDINDNPLNQKPTVGSGPWLFKEWVKDSHAIFAANDKYFLGRPNLDQVVFRVVADSNVVVAMLKAGEVDRGSIQAADWEDMKKVSHLQLFNYYNASPSWVYVGFNMKSAFFDDVRVRQAFTHAVNRQLMTERIRFGHARPMHSTYAPGSWAYTDDVPKFNFDVAKSKQLLDAAGWTMGSAGIRQKDGKPFKIRIFYNAGNKEREQVATIMQQNLKDVGVEAEVISEEWNAYLNRVQKTKDAEMWVLGWSAGIEPWSFHNNIWHSQGGQNDSGYANPRIDELVQAGAYQPGCKQDDRKKIYAEVQKIVANDQPYMFLWENEALVGMHNRLVANPMSKIGNSYRMWEWYSKTGK